MTLLSASVFLLKIHLISMARRSFGKSIKVHTLFSYMDLISDFMASSHFVESGLIVASSQFIGSSWSSKMTSRTWLLYHSGADLTLLYLRGLVVTWSEVTWSSSLTSSLIGVGVTGTDFYDELLSNKGAGIVTSSSSTFLPLTSFERNSFSRKDPFLATNILSSDLW